MWISYFLFPIILCLAKNQTWFDPIKKDPDLSVFVEFLDPQNPDVIPRYELAKEPITFRFYQDCGDNSSIPICLCYEADHFIFESIRNLTILGPCIKGFFPVCSTVKYSDVSFFTGYGPDEKGAPSTAGSTLLSFRIGQVRHSLPMVVRMMKDPDINYVPTVRLYSIPSSKTNCSKIVVDNLYSKTQNFEEIKQKNGYSVAENQACVLGCHCPNFPDFLYFG